VRRCHGRSQQRLCDGIQTTTDNTLDVTAAGADSNDNDERHYLFSDHGPVEVDITAGSDIDGFGLPLRPPRPAPPLSSITRAPSASMTTVRRQAGLASSTSRPNGGNVTYTGNGNVIDNDGGNNGLVIDTGVGAGNITIGSAGTPVTPTYQGFVALRTISGTGDQNIFLDGGTLVATDALGDGIFASSSTGDINIDLTGNTQITTTVASPNIVWGVRTESSGGATTISSDADIGSAGFELNRGISSFSADGPIDITQTGGTIMATSSGIIATSVGGTGDISIATDAGSQIR
jgi:subtilase-type serine protease